MINVENTKIIYSIKLLSFWIVFMSGIQLEFKTVLDIIHQIKGNRLSEEEKQKCIYI